MIAITVGAFAKLTTKLTTVIIVAVVIDAGSSVSMIAIKTVIILLPTLLQVLLVIPNAFVTWLLLSLLQLLVTT